MVTIHQLILQKDSSDIMAHSAGSSFLSFLSAELPDSIKLQQQTVRLEEEKKRLTLMADKEEGQLLKISQQYKSTKFRIEQVDDQLRKAKTELKSFEKSSEKKLRKIRRNHWRMSSLDLQKSQWMNRGEVIF